jgi:7-cyano-7-deazaguanine synthase
MKSAIVVLSGGLDSSANLALAIDELDVKMAITFNYGQRAAAKEIHASGRLCQHFGVRHKIVDIPWVAQFGKSALIDKNSDVPTTDVNIDDQIVSGATAAKVWVPNRNGIFLNIAAGWAEALACDYIIPGFNLEEASTFPDNSLAFTQALNKSFSYSTANHVVVKCYTISMMKTQILRLAIQKNLPLNLIWPCYLDGEMWCGQCESCQRSKRAFTENGLQISSYFKKAQ